MEQPSTSSMAALPLVPVENPCRNWQAGWTVRCERLCCHTHPKYCPCADITCDGCGKSIVRANGATTVSMNGQLPATRYVCLEADIDVNYTG